MTEEKYSSLINIKQQVARKKEINRQVKQDLTRAVSDIHTIDDVTNLLDYKAYLKNNSPEELQRTEKLRKIQYKSLNKTYEAPVKRSGRNAIFNEDPSDIVSKFRSFGIRQYRTASMTVVRKPENESKSKMWDQIKEIWKDKMIDWIDKNDQRLSNDEKKVDTIRFNLVENNNSDNSNFGKEILSSLNDHEDSVLKLIKYHNGEITEAAKTIMVIDLSNS